MALALMLLVGASLLIRSFMALRAVNPGFATHNILTLRMALAEAKFSNTAGLDQLTRSGTGRLRALPGVEAATATCCIPLVGDRTQARAAGSARHRDTSTYSAFRCCAAATSTMATGPARSKS